MNDKKTKIKNRLWMIMAFIILFLLCFLLAYVIVIAIYGNEGLPIKFNATSILVMCGLSFLTATVLLTTIYILLLRPLDKINVAMREVAKGDFSVVLKHKSPIAELKSMRESFNVMTHDLSGMETLRNDFVVGVSHEFNTPIAAIEGYATLLRGENLSEESRKKYVEKIIDNARNLSDLTGNILRLSRLENQEILTENIFRLDEQIRRVLLLLEKKWEEKELELDLDLPKTECKGNEELMQIMWYNLISNAIKFSNKGGTLKITVTRGEKIAVSIADNGIGISEEDQKHVFEKFYQADKSHSSGGNGLGLALVKRIVDLHAGEIILRSEVGKGSDFTVRLNAQTR